MREAARIIKPDGRVVIALANFESISCRLGRNLDRLKWKLGRPRPDWRMYWETPEDHNVKGDLPYVQSLGGDALVLDRCFGISALWLVLGYGACSTGCRRAPPGVSGSRSTATRESGRSTRT